MRKLRFLPLAVLLLGALLLAGCGGGGSKSVPQNAIAIVGSDTVTKTQYNDLLAAARSTYKARKTPFPAVGTTAYKSLSDQAVTYLVQESELEQKAKELGVAVTAKDVQTQLKQIKAQYFGGSEKKYQAQLKAQGLTEAQLEQDVRAQLLSQKIYDKVTSDVKVSNAAVEKYYKAHIDQYTSRDVRHILVNSKATAEKLETQLKHGASFAALAKKYSKDTSSAKLGGKLTIQKGQTVAPFDKTAFSLKTNEISPPVHTTYGWHIIQALSPVKTTPLKSVSATIQQNLLSTKKNSAMQSWVNALKKEYASKVVYQTGYEPAATTTSPATTTG